MGELLLWLIVGTFLLLLVKALWPFVLVMGAVYLLAVLFKRARRNARARLDAQQAENARLIANADREHALVMAGDEAGVYGQYPPALRSIVWRH
ncbi:hypothetical protein ACQI5H_23785 [Mycobacterium heidelbergense]|uniref:hypothetical protein n=1 Tax=Mycobacterium heidelbergense TaxID=53376 RepID=UPI003CF545FB